MSDDHPSFDIGDQLAAHLNLICDTNESEDDAELNSTPIFTENARQSCLKTVKHWNRKGQKDKVAPFSQFGLIAGNLHLPSTEDCRLFQNIAAPSSTFICGSQGSGKSHTLSCLLENCLVPCVSNVLPRPLSGIVFHYDTFISDTGGSPCEAAYLASHSALSVRILCAPTNIVQIKRIYEKVPNVRVEELRIEETDLNTRRMLDLMAISSIKGDGMPLYLHVITRMLRELRIQQQRSGAPFNYGKLKEMISQERTLNEGQLAPLRQRLETLESFMVKTQTTTHDSGKVNPKPVHTKKKPEQKETGTLWEPRAGQLTVVDLSCPCVTAEMACSLFGISLSLFLEKGTNIGRVIALDEAHKYMTNSPECQNLTESLLSAIRLQRHLGARIFISTQEPTISPRLLDLCSVTVVHRFTSPEWLKVLRKHLAGMSQQVTPPKKAGPFTEIELPTEGEEVPNCSNLIDSGEDLFGKVVTLRTGEALLSAPSAIMGVDRHGDVLESLTSEAQGSADGHILGNMRITKLGHGILKVRIRRRVTEDGGQSVMAS